MVENIAIALVSQADGDRRARADIPALVHAELSAFLRERVTSLVAADASLEPLALTACDAVLSGGKRIRPTFAYWGWRGVSRHDGPDRILPALAALEMLHAFALVHDDVMDRSTTRRGIRTAHRRLTDLHTERKMRGDAVRFGESAAILVGDLCLVWADQLMADTATAPGVVGRARRVYDRMRVDAIAGQFLDVLSECTTTWTIEQALHTARLKTASYTVTQPLLYGAALAERDMAPDTAVTAAYAGYGNAVGEAFQLRDDLLGLFGEPAVTGKPARDDLALIKPTVVLQLTRSLASAAQRRHLDRALRRGRLADHTRVAGIVADTGALGRVEEMISERIDDATRILASAPIDPLARTALDDLSTAAAWRMT